MGYSFNQSTEQNIRAAAYDNILIQESLDSMIIMTNQTQIPCFTLFALIALEKIPIRILQVPTKIKIGHFLDCRVSAIILCISYIFLGLHLQIKSCNAVNSSYIVIVYPQSQVWSLISIFSSLAAIRGKIILGQFQKLSGCLTKT